MPTYQPPTTTEMTAPSAVALGAADRLRADLMTKDEFAELVAKSPRTIDRWVRERTCPPFVRTGNSICFRRESVEEWLKTREIRAESKSRSRRG